MRNRHGGQFRIGRNKLLAELLNTALKDPDISTKLVQGGFDLWTATHDALTVLGARARIRYREQVKKFGDIEN